MCGAHAGAPLVEAPSSARGSQGNHADRPRSKPPAAVPRRLRRAGAPRAPAPAARRPRGRARPRRERRGVPPVPDREPGERRYGGGGQELRGVLHAERPTGPERPGPLGDRGERQPVVGHRDQGGHHDEQRRRRPGRAPRSVRAGAIVAAAATATQRSGRIRPPTTSERWPTAIRPRAPTTWAIATTTPAAAGDQSRSWHQPHQRERPDQELRYDEQHRDAVDPGQVGVLAVGVGEPRCPRALGSRRVDDHGRDQTAASAQAIVGTQRAACDAVLGRRPRRSRWRRPRPRPAAPSGGCPSPGRAVPAGTSRRRRGRWRRWCWRRPRRPGTASARGPGCRPRTGRPASRPRWWRPGRSAARTVRPGGR